MELTFVQKFCEARPRTSWDKELLSKEELFTGKSLMQTQIIFAQNPTGEEPERPKETSKWLRRTNDD